nr:DNA-directed RNA polymerase 40k chain [Cryptomonas curvata]
MEKFDIWNEDICPLNLIYAFNKDLVLVFILTKTKYNYLGFLIGIDTRLNILFGKSFYSFSTRNFTYIRNYEFLYINSDKIISITPVKLNNLYI